MDWFVSELSAAAKQAKSITKSIMKEMKLLMKWLIGVACFGCGGSERRPKGPNAPR